jgi:hypothetical protein
MSYQRSQSFEERKTQSEIFSFGSARTTDSMAFPTYPKKDLKEESSPKYERNN